MANAAAIRTKVAALLKRLNATARVVKFRTVTQTGGSAELGLGGTWVTTDVVIDPQPAVRVLDAVAVANSAGLLLPGDYELTFAGTVSETSLRTQMILYGDEVLKVVMIEPAALGGLVIAWRVIARTASPA